MNTCPSRSIGLLTVWVWLAVMGAAGVQAGPRLEWVGSPGYESDGLEPDLIYAGQTVVFRVAVTLSGIPGVPLARGFPKLRIFKDETEVTGSPFSMGLKEIVSYSPPSTAIFEARVPFSEPGIYTYTFECEDRNGEQATGEPTQQRLFCVRPEGSASTLVYAWWEDSYGRKTWYTFARERTEWNEPSLDSPFSYLSCMRAVIEVVAGGKRETISAHVVGIDESGETVPLNIVNLGTGLGYTFTTRDEETLEPFQTARLNVWFAPPVPEGFSFTVHLGPYKDVQDIVRTIGPICRYVLEVHGRAEGDSDFRLLGRFPIRVFRWRPTVVDMSVIGPDGSPASFVRKGEPYDLLLTVASPFDTSVRVRPLVDLKLSPDVLHLAIPCWQICPVLGFIRLPFPLSVSLNFPPVSVALAANQEKQVRFEWTPQTGTGEQPPMIEDILEDVEDAGVIGPTIPDNIKLLYYDLKGAEVRYQQDEYIDGNGAKRIVSVPGHGPNVIELGPHELQRATSCVVPSGCGHTDPNGWLMVKASAASPQVPPVPGGLPIALDVDDCQASLFFDGSWLPEEDDEIYVVCAARGFGSVRGLDIPIFGFSVRGAYFGMRFRAGDSTQIAEHEVVPPLEDAIQRAILQLSGVKVPLQIATAAASVGTDLASILAYCDTVGVTRDLPPLTTIYTFSPVQEPISLGVQLRARAVAVGLSWREVSAIAKVERVIMFGPRFDVAGEDVASAETLELDSEPVCRGIGAGDEVDTYVVDSPGEDSVLKLTLVDAPYGALRVDVSIDGGPFVPLAGESPPFAGRVRDYRFPVSASSTAVYWQLLVTEDQPGMQEYQINVTTEEASPCYLTAGEGMMSSGIEADQFLEGMPVRFAVTIHSMGGVAVKGGYPELHIIELDSGTEVPGSPFSMEFESGDSYKGNFVYSALFARGNYVFWVEARDKNGRLLCGEPAIPHEFVVHRCTQVVSAPEPGQGATDEDDPPGPYGYHTMADGLKPFYDYWYEVTPSAGEVINSFMVFTGVQYDGDPSQFFNWYAPPGWVRRLVIHSNRWAILWTNVNGEALADITGVFGFDHRAEAVWGRWETDTDSSDSYNELENGYGYLVHVPGPRRSGPSDVYVRKHGNHVFPYANVWDAATSVVAAAEAVGDGGTVHVASGTYSLDREVKLYHGTRLVGNGRMWTILDGQHTTRCVKLIGSSVVEKVTIRNGSASVGAGVQGGRTNEWVKEGYVVDCEIAGNAASAYGGGVYRCRVLKSLIRNNTAVLGGGGLFNCDARACVIAHNTCTDADSSEGGGALSCRLNRCRVKQNSAAFGGGAAYSKLVDCEVERNEAFEDGGGVYGWGSELVRCTVEYNRAAKNGGGVYNVGMKGGRLGWNRAGRLGGGAAGGTLRDVRIERCTARDGGGVAYADLEHCDLSDNSAAGRGGAAFESDVGWSRLADNRAAYGAGAAGGTLWNCRLISNQARRDGGGVAGSIVYNSLFVGNEAVRVGGAAVGAHLENCTLWGNSARIDGGGAYAGFGLNCIICGNSAGHQYDNVYDPGGSYYYCCVPEALEGAGNITADPRFLNAAAGDFRLREDSLCIDAGENRPWMTNAVDLAGNARVMGIRVDMGAYESGGQDWEASGPVLTWAGMPGYENDGVEPDVVSVGTVAAFRVTVKLASKPDGSGSVPLRPGYPKLHVLLAGEEIEGSPFSMELEAVVETSPPSAARFVKVLSFEEAGEYTYYFEAVDKHGVVAVGAPCSPQSLEVKIWDDSDDRLVIFEDDFEGYAEGSLPDGWQKIYSGAGWEACRVENGVLRMEGRSGWAQVIGRMIPWFGEKSGQVGDSQWNDSEQGEGYQKVVEWIQRNPRLYVEVDVKVDNLPEATWGEGVGWVGFYKVYPRWGRWFGKLGFSLCGEGRMCTPDRMPVELGRWHRVQVVSDFRQRKYWSWIDGRPVAVGEEMGAEGYPTLVSLCADNCGTPMVVYYDNFSFGIWQGREMRELSYWRFDDGTGSVASNEVEGQPAMVLDGAEWVERDGGYALGFDGQGDCAWCESDWGRLSGILVSFLMRADSLREMADEPGVYPAPLSRAWRMDYPGEFYINTLDGGKGLYFGIQTTEGRFDLYTTNAFLQTGIWHRVQASYDGRHMALYLDGRLLDMRPAGGQLPEVSIPFRVGRDGRMPRWWHGAIDEVRVWGLYAETNVPPETPPRLLWAGIPGYVDDGVEPDVVSVGTVAVFRVTVKLASNPDGPGSVPLRPGYPKLHVLLAGEEIEGSPFRMELEAVVETSPPSAARFVKVLSFEEAGEYTYYFEALDKRGCQAVGPPTEPQSMTVSEPADQSGNSEQSGDGDQSGNSDEVTLSIEATPTILRVGQVIRVSGRLVDGSGAGMKNKTIELNHALQDGSPLPTFVSTDEQGYFSRDYLTTQAGIHRIWARYFGGAGYVATAWSPEVTVKVLDACAWCDYAVKHLAGDARNGLQNMLCFHWRYGSGKYLLPTAWPFHFGQENLIHSGEADIRKLLGPLGTHFCQAVCDIQTTRGTPPSEEEMVQWLKNYLAIGLTAVARRNDFAARTTDQLESIVQSIYDQLELISGPVESMALQMVRLQTDEFFDNLSDMADEWYRRDALRNYLEDALDYASSSIRAFVRAAWGGESGGE